MSCQRGFSRFGLLRKFPTVRLELGHGYLDIWSFVQELVEASNRFNDKSAILYLE